MELHDIYRLGALVNYFRRLPIFLKANSSVYVYGDNFVISALKEMRNTLEKYKISIHSQKSIKQFEDNLQNDYLEEKNPQIKSSDAEVLRDYSRIWSDRISVELANTVVFRAFTDGRLNANKLCEGAKSFFQLKIWRKFSKIIKDDFEESAKCLLTQSWTASGLMSMRALESGVRKYYTDITNISGDDKTYGQMTGELRKNPNADSRLIGYLDYLKDIRNDLAHPNIRINQFEAEQAFQHTIQILTIVFS